MLSDLTEENQGISCFSHVERNLNIFKLVGCRLLLNHKNDICLNIYKLVEFRRRIWWHRCVHSHRPRSPQPCQTRHCSACSVSGLSALLSVFYYIEFAVAIPIAGGFYSYLRIELGDIVALVATNNLILVAVIGTAALESLQWVVLGLLT